MEKIPHHERFVAVQWNTFEDYVRHTLPYMTKGETTAKRTAAELIEIVERLTKLNIWDFSYTHVTNASFVDHPIIKFIEQNRQEQPLKNQHASLSQTKLEECKNKEIIDGVFRLIKDDNPNLTAVLKRYIQDRKTVRDIITERIAQIQKELESTKKYDNKTPSLGVIQEYFNSRLTDLSQELIGQTYIATHPSIVREFGDSPMPASMSRAFAKEVTTAKITINRFLFSTIMVYANVHNGEHPTDRAKIMQYTVPNRSKFSTVDDVLFVNHHATCPAIHSAEQLAKYLTQMTVAYWQETAITEE